MRLLEVMLEMLANPAFNLTRRSAQFSDISLVAAGRLTRR